MLAVSVVVVLIALASPLLGLFALLRNPHDSQNRSFFLFTALIFIWTNFNYFGSTILDPELTKWLVLSDFASGIFLAWAFWLFSRILYIKTIGKKLKTYLVPVFAALNILATIATYTSNVVSVSIVDNELSLTNAKLYVFYSVLVFFYLLVGLGSLIAARIRSKGQSRVQVSVILYGLLVTTILVVVPNLVLPNLLERTAVLTNLQYLAYVGFLVFAAVISYAITKHRLFDIRLVVARSVAYTLLLSSLGFIYGGAVFGVSNLFFEGQKVSLTQQLVYIILALVIALTFQPLRRFFEKATDRVFYRDRYESQTVLNAINNILTSQIDLKVITSATLTQICETLKLMHGEFVVLDDTKIYHTARYGRHTPKAVNYAELAKLHENLIIADELEANQLRHLLHEHELNASLRLKTQEGVVGYLLLGPKQNGSIYVEQDIRLLEILGNELAIAVQNARSYEKIAKFNVTLQKRIQEATYQLQAQNKRLKELDQAKDEFISMASHQLRTPLTSIKGYLSMLEEGDAGKLNDKQYEFTDSAFSSAQRMIYLISDMLNVSRINTGKLVIDKTTFNLDAVIRDEVKQLKRAADSRRSKIQYTPPPAPLPSVTLDEGKLRQVIMNFIDNAIYYAPGTTIEVSLKRDNNKIHFEVRDHGIGVPPEAQARLFTKFYRAENAKQTRPDGTGLGLFMAKMVIEMQGGSVVFQSEVGKGSVFGFEFPLEELKPLVAKSATPLVSPASAVDRNQSASAANA